MSTWPERLDRLSGQLARLGVRPDAPFAKPEVIIEALTHSSYAGEHGMPNNERLEFLGDAVLGFVVAEMLFDLPSREHEGTLTKARASLVDERALAERARQLEIGNLLELGKGAERSGERERASVLSGAFEAVVAGIYRSEGLDVVRRLAQVLFGWDAHLLAGRPAPRDYKTLLQQHTQQKWRTLPAYTVVSMTGPDHARQFEVEVTVQGEVRGRGRGMTKRAAEQEAAQAALASFGMH